MVTLKLEGDSESISLQGLSLRWETEVSSLSGAHPPVPWSSWQAALGHLQMMSSELLPLAPGWSVEEFPRANWQPRLF